MVRNADKLYFPIEESIRSILPIVDEFIIALGKGDKDDKTEKIIKSINSDKIKIYPRVWSEESFRESRILAEETNYALSKCAGKWCFYLQADEVVHEKDHRRIVESCTSHTDDERIEGLLFKYNHFWGDYGHVLRYHGWYKNEIRVVKNHSNIISIRDAQSFRKRNDEKLNVVDVDATIYHYGWVRPPSLMQNKKKIHEGLHVGISNAEKLYQERDNHYDYGPLGRINTFSSSHPEVMSERIKSHYWKDDLNYSKKWTPTRPLNKHEKLKYRVWSWIENNFYGGKEIFGYHNWNRVRL